MPRASRLNLILIPLAALAAILPLLIHGISCGQDMPFHLQSWLDAAAQLRHGHYPQWAFTPAWSAGEPRFIFYPPISWLLGALLTTLIPISAAPIAYILLALTASGFSMYCLAKHFVSPTAALLASVFYLANPYMLFCAFERTAFAELLAAAWIPLLFLALMRPRPTIRGIAVPIALLWLTNAPAAVMGCYTFALIATLRVAYALYAAAQRYPEASASGLISREKLKDFSPEGMPPFRLSITYLLGTILGLALPAFYLVPAAYERRFVQVAMAIIPNMRYQDNFLFTRTADAAHNAVNHTASTLALTVLILTAFVITAVLATHDKPVILTEPKTSFRNPDASASALIPTLKEWGFSHAALLAVLTLLIGFLLTPFSGSIWEHLPNFAYLQFPWRLLTILSAVLAFAIALLIPRLRFAPSLSPILYPLSPVVALCLSFTAYHLYAQACDHASLPTSIAALFKAHHGAPPTDEYTPTDADNDHLRTDNPGYWFANSPNDPSPNTTPTSAELNPNIATDDNPTPDAQTLSTLSPVHLEIHAPARGYLILNLRTYPNWKVTEVDANAISLYDASLIPRDDGLIAITLWYPSTYYIDITWHRTFDQTLGLMTSALAILALAFTYRTRQRTP